MYVYVCTTGAHRSWKVIESHRILQHHFSGLKSYGKQQRSWKVLENDDNVVLFLLYSEKFCSCNVILLAVVASFTHVLISDICKYV